MESQVHEKTAANRPRRYRRRQYIVNPAVQWKYAVTISIAVFFISSVMGSALYGLLHHQARLRTMNPDTYVAEVTLVLVLFGLGFSVLTAGAMGVWSILATHRICGPLFVLHRHLTELAQGHIPKLRPLRKKDEYKELFATFSEVVEALKADKQAAIAALTETLNTARSALNGDDARRKDTLESVARRIEALRDAAKGAMGGAADDASCPSEVTHEPVARRPVGVT